MDTKRNLVVSGSYDTTLKVWELNTGACLNTLRGHSGAVLAVQVVWLVTSYRTYVFMKEID
jgi:WD40 repeat protein